MKTLLKYSLFIIPIVLLFVWLNSSTAPNPTPSPPPGNQLKLYEDQFNGGVTAGGYQTAYNADGTGTFDVHIAPGSSIRKAYLLVGRYGNAPDITITLNGMSIPIDRSSEATPNFNSIYGGASATHVIDLTNSISPGTTQYTLTVPPQAMVVNRYQAFYLYIAYSNPALPEVSTAIFLSTTDHAPATLYDCNLTYPVRNAFPIGMSLFTSYVCNLNPDQQTINVNGSQVGIIGGQDANGGGYCAGPIGSFYYESNALTGLLDDTANATMAGPDALADISSITPDLSPLITGDFQANGNSNAIWGVILAYSGQTLLPVEFSYFEAEAGKRDINLSWGSAKEENVEKFVIERAGKDQEFEPIGQEAARHRDGGEYTVTDFDPLEGANFYRLKVLDLDGAYHYSTTAYAHFSYVNGFEFKTVYPNPASEEVFAQIDAGRQIERLQARIISINGAIAGEYEFCDLEPGTHTQVFDIRGLEPGAYFLVFRVGSQAHSKLIEVR